MLDRGQQREIKRIAQRQAAGIELNVRELRTIQPFAGQFVAEQGQRRGEALGAPSLFRQFGETDLLDQRQQDVNRLAGTAQLTQEGVEKVGQVAETIKRGVANILNRLDLIEDAFRDDQQRRGFAAG